LCTPDYKASVLVNRKAESLDHLLGFGPRHARSYQLSDHLDDVDGMNVGTLDDGLNLFVPGSWSMTAPDYLVASASPNG
jgi:hypothetical protein